MLRPRRVIRTAARIARPGGVSRGDDSWRTMSPVMPSRPQATNPPARPTPCGSKVRSSWISPATPGRSSILRQLPSPTRSYSNDDRADLGPAIQQYRPDGTPATSGLAHQVRGAAPDTLELLKAISHGVSGSPCSTRCAKAKEPRLIERSSAARVRAATAILFAEAAARYGRPYRVGYLYDPQSTATGSGGSVHPTWAEVYVPGRLGSTSIQPTAASADSIWFRPPWPVTSLLLMPVSAVMRARRRLRGDGGRGQVG